MVFSRTFFSPLGRYMPTSGSGILFTWLLRALQQPMRIHAWRCNALVPACSARSRHADARTCCMRTHIRAHTHTHVQIRAPRYAFAHTVPCTMLLHASTQQRTEDTHTHTHTHTHTQYSQHSWFMYPNVFDKTSSPHHKMQRAVLHISTQQHTEDTHTHTAHPTPMFYVPVPAKK